jgi:hypothetical protein
MSLSAVLILWLLASGVLSLLALAWATLAALAGGGARKLAWALMVVTALLAAWPAVLARWGGSGPGPFGPPLLVGCSLILLAALVCLERLRHVPGAALAARVGIGAVLNLWLALAVTVLLPA